MTNPTFYHSGHTGRLYYGTATEPSGTVRDWSFQTQLATLDATTLGDTYKVPVNGIRTVTGSATLFWSSAPAADANRGWVPRRMLSDLISVRTGGTSFPGEANEATQAVRLELRVEDGYTATGVTGRGISMQIKITSAQMTMAHGEIFSANIGFESIGAPTEFSLGIT